MCKWKNKYNENMLSPIFVLVKADFADGKILGSKYNPDCYPVGEYKIVDEEKIVKEVTK